MFSIRSSYMPPTTDCRQRECRQTSAQLLFPAFSSPPPPCVSSSSDADAFLRPTARPKALAIAKFQRDNESNDLHACNTNTDGQNGRNRFYYATGPTVPLAQFSRWLALVTWPTNEYWNSKREDFPVGGITILGRFKIRSNYS